MDDKLVDDKLIDVTNVLEDSTNQIKMTGERAGKCDYCKKNSLHLLRCSDCCQMVYCSKDCQVNHRQQHKYICKKIKKIRKIKNFSDRLSKVFLRDRLIEHAKIYLRSSLKGCIAFRELPMSMLDKVQQIVEGTGSSASYVHDIQSKKLYHFFILQVASLEAYIDDGGIPKEYMEFVKCPRSYRRFIPAFEMIFDNNDEVEELSFYILKKKID